MLKQLCFLALANCQTFPSPGESLPGSQATDFFQPDLVGDKQVWGLETSNNKVFASFFRDGLRHQNLFDPNEYYVDQTGDSIRGLLLVNSTFAYSAEYSGNWISSVTLDAKMKTAEPKRICEFPNGFKFADMALSIDGELYFSATQSGPGGYGQGAKGNIYKCTSQGTVPVLEDFSDQIAGLVVDSDSLIMLSAVVVGNDTKNSTISKLSLKDNTIEMLAVKEFNYLTRSHALRKSGSHLYALWGHSNVVYKLGLTGTIIETTQLDFSANNIALHARGNEEILVVSGRSRSLSKFKVEFKKL